MVNYYRIPIDSRDLNYEIYEDQGEESITNAIEYHSHNTHRLNEQELTKMLQNLYEIQNDLN